MLKVFVIDDTVVYRKIVTDLASSFNGVEVVGSAPTGDIALKKMESIRPDFVFCDVYMPGMNGVETLKEIKKRFPNTVVVMMSGISTRNADITIKALQEGAIDFIRKPDGKTIDENIKQLKDDFERVLKLAEIKLGKKRTGSSTSIPSSVIPTKKTAVTVPQRKGLTPTNFSVVAIGVSTGGPEALNRFIPMLPANLPVPVVVVQHMPKGFTKSLAESLNRKSPITVVEGEEGMPLEKGYVYIAPGGLHMVVREKNGVVYIGTNDGPPENSCKPAVDVLFRSVAAVYGDKGVLAVILTGMGSDGAKGVATLKRKSCYCITQSPESCVVYGMPKAVDDAGLSDKSLPIDQIADEIKTKLRVF